MAVLSALGQARDTALLESVTLSPLGTGDALLFHCCLDPASAASEFDLWKSV